MTGLFLSLRFVPVEAYAFWGTAGARAICIKKGLALFNANPLFCLAPPAGLEPATH